MKSIREEQKPTQNGPKLIPIDKNLLPSRGRYYKSDLFCRKLTAIETKDLSKLKTSTVNSVFNQVLSGAISGIEVEDIMLNDRLWLIYFLRSITYDDIPFKVFGTCPICGDSGWYEYKLRDLDVTYANEDLERELELTNGDRVTLSFPTIGDELEIARTKADPNLMENIDVDVMTVASHIRSINGEPVSIYEAYVYFSRGKGSAKDYSRLLTHLRKYAFGASPKGAFKCRKCKQSLLVDIPLGSDFFLPEI